MDSFWDEICSTACKIVCSFYSFNKASHLSQVVNVVVRRKSSKSVLTHTVYEDFFSSN